MDFSNKKFYAFTLIVALLYAFTIFDTAFIFEHNAYWLEPYADRITNHIGLLYFIQDSWHWPLFYVPSLAYPEGANIIYTDSLPLFALVMKILYKTSGLWFNYFGLWIFVCFPLLALMVGLCLRECQCKDPIALLGGILLALASPALLIRFGHAALMGHFLVVWAFWCYLKFKHHQRIWSLTWSFSLLAALCILLQTYFILMVMPFFAAAIAQAVFERRLKIFLALQSFAVVMFFTLATAFISGMIGPNTPSATAGGFGLYSMNLLSPFLPNKAHLPAFIADHIHWDGNGYTWDATAGQYEGYNYLGLGVMLLFLFQCKSFWATLKSSFKSHLFLVFALICLILLALSNRIYLGDWLVVHTANKPWLAYFRTSGRLFWPVYYVLVIALIVNLFRKFPRRTARFILLTAVLWQLWDTSLLRQNLVVAARTGTPPALSHEVWKQLLSQHQFLEQYPSFQCGGWAGGWPADNSNMEVLLLAAEQNIPTNSAYLARTSRSCLDESVGALSAPLKKGGLYIFGQDFLLREIRHAAFFNRHCREFAWGFVCTLNDKALAELTPAKGFRSPMPVTPAVYVLGNVLHFMAGGNGNSYLDTGWYIPEEWGTWSRGKESQLVLKLPHVKAEAYRLTIFARGFVTDKHPQKEISVYVGNKKLAVWQYRHGKELVQQHVDIPREAFDKHGILKIKFVSSLIESPFDAGLSSDRKEISLGLMGMLLTALKQG